jgi:hypothetical protein
MVSQWRHRALVSLLVGVLVVLTACSAKSGSKQASSTTTRPGGTPTSAGGGVTTAAPGTAGCTTASTTASGQPGAGDAAPPGDIPDTQAYVVFTPASSAYSIKVPEGWARTDAQDGVTFSDKFNSIKVQLVPAPVAATPASAQSNEVPAIAASANCYAAGSVTSVTRAAGPAVLITYKTDGAPNPVTGKAVRQDVERYEFWRNGTEAIVTLSAPAGSDNVDPWKLVTGSFTWK